MENLQQIWQQSLQEIDNYAKQDEYITQIKDFLAPLLNQEGILELEFRYDSFPNMNPKLQFKIGTGSTYEWFSFDFYALPVEKDFILPLPQEKNDMCSNQYFLHALNNRIALIKKRFIQKILPQAEIQEVTIGYSNRNWSHTHYLLITIPNVGYLRLFCYKSSEEEDD